MCALVVLLSAELLQTVIHFSPANLPLRRCHRCGHNAALVRHQTWEGQARYRCVHGGMHDLMTEVVHSPLDMHTRCMEERGMTTSTPTLTTPSVSSGIFFLGVSKTRRSTESVGYLLLHSTLALLTASWASAETRQEQEAGTPAPSR